MPGLMIEEAETGQVRQVTCAGIKSSADIGISKPDAFIPPRDDELDDIMEILSVNWGSRMLPLIPAWSKGAVGVVAAAGLMGGYPALSCLRRVFRYPQATRGCCLF